MEFICIRDENQSVKNTCTVDNKANIAIVRTQFDIHDNIKLIFSTVMITLQCIWSPQIFSVCCQQYSIMFISLQYINTCTFKFIYSDKNYYIPVINTTMTLIIYCIYQEIFTFQFHVNLLVKRGKYKFSLIFNILICTVHLICIFTYSCLTK